MIELGNGDKFLFDIGIGSMANVAASGLSKMAKQFETEGEWVWGVAQECERWPRAPHSVTPCGDD